MLNRVHRRRSRPFSAVIALLVMALALVATRAWAAAGALDNTFSSDGRKTFGFGNGSGDDRDNGVAIQRDGKIVLAGTSGQSATGPDFALARVNANGGVDHTFSGDGRKTIGFANGVRPDSAEAVAIQSDGRIVVTGGSAQGTDPSDMAVARFKPDGSVDHTFSGDGRKTITFGTDEDSGSAVALQRDGKIVVAGYTIQSTTSYDCVVARFDPNGSPDHTFSGDGRRVLRFVAGDKDDFCEGVAIQGDGRIVVAGNSQQPATFDDFAVARFRPNGKLDPTFSGDGRKTIAVPGGENDSGYAVEIQRDGKIVVAGESSVTPTSWELAVARLKAGGAPDQTFSGDGRKTIGFGNPGGVAGGRSLALQRDGKIVVAGYSGEGDASRDFAVARFKPNGNLDPTFSGDGRRTIGFGNPGGDDVADALALQRDGKAVVGGFSDQGATGNDFAVARFLAG
jgi:uncharacterized delta-60 repeat protein